MKPIVDHTQNSTVFKQNNYGMGECLNGIAYHEGHKHIYVTGKSWPYIYKIQFKEGPESPC